MSKNKVNIPLQDKFKAKKTFRVVCLSDTHNRLNECIENKGKFS